MKAKIGNARDSYRPQKYSNTDPHSDYPFYVDTKIRFSWRDLLLQLAIVAATVVAVSLFT